MTYIKDINDLEDEKIFRWLVTTDKLSYVNCCLSNTREIIDITDYRITSHQTYEYEGTIAVKYKEFSFIHIYCKKCGYILSSFDKAIALENMRKESQK